MYCNAIRLERMIIMKNIITKYQKCGKKNCHCDTGELLHGPYYWFVKYVKPRNSYSKGKYKWMYIGKTPDELEEFKKSRSNQ